MSKNLVEIKNPTESWYETKTKKSGIAFIVIVIIVIMLLIFGSVCYYKYLNYPDPANIPKVYVVGTYIFWILVVIIAIIFIFVLTSALRAPRVA